MCDPGFILCISVFLRSLRASSSCERVRGRRSVESCVLPPRPHFLSDTITHRRAENRDQAFVRIKKNCDETHLAERAFLPLFLLVR